MKPTLLFISLFFLTSCTYQYLTVSGVNLTKKENHSFQSENDSLKLDYSFKDYHAKVGINIYNKLNEPIEIDWKKSAIIVGDNATSYYKPSSSFSGTLESTNLPNTQRNIQGTVIGNEVIESIPPKSSIFREPIFMPIEKIDNLPEKQFQKVSSETSSHIFWDYKTIKFEKEKSPIVLRSYLTFRTLVAGVQKEFSIEHQFYISEIWNSTTSPEEFPENVVRRNDRFYLN